MPRPRAGDWLEDEVASWRRSGLEVVVSLLEDGEIAELGLEQEAELCRQGGIRFVRLPIPDRGIPTSPGEVSALVRMVVAELRGGRGVGIHCRIGVGRSALVAACVMAALGVPVDAAWSSLHRSRGLSVPDTEAQRAWVSAWLTDFRDGDASSG
jgi:protein-tyrosine phosphatase